MNKYIKLSLIFLIVIILFVAVSCNKKESYSEKEVYKGNLNIVTDAKYEDQFRTSAEKFKEIYKKVNVNVKTDSNIQGNLKNLLSDNSSDADIISINDENLEYDLNKFKNNILDLTDSVSNYKNTIISNKIYIDTVNGRIYGMPWDASPELILYRKDIFKNENININDIKTWDDYINIGKKLSGDKCKNFIGNNEASSNFNLILANQLGTSYFNYNKKLDFNSEKWNRIFELKEQIYNENLIVNFNSEKELIKAAQSGNIVSVIANPYTAYDLMKAMPDSKNMWGVMKLPAFECGGNNNVSIGGINLIVNKNSKNSKLAEEFIKFALTDDNLQIELLNKYGRLPVYKNSYNFVDMDKYIGYFDNKIWKLFSDSQNGAFNIEYTKYFPDIYSEINSFLDPTNIKNKDAKTVFSDIEKALENKLK